MDISAMNNLTQHVSAPTEPVFPQPVSQDQRILIQAVKAVNATEFFGENNELTFIMDRATRRAVVRIVDRTSGEVVEQIPSEYVLRMAEELKRS
jgi:flagellar protein FlaG